MTRASEDAQACDDGVEESKDVDVEPHKKQSKPAGW